MAFLLKALTRIPGIWPITRGHRATEVFAGKRLATGREISTTVTWSTETPSTRAISGLPPSSISFRLEAANALPDLQIGRSTPLLADGRQAISLSFSRARGSHPTFRAAILQGPALGSMAAAPSLPTTSDLLTPSARVRTSGF